jgi:hypothetical protein
MMTLETAIPQRPFGGVFTHRPRSIEGGVLLTLFVSVVGGEKEKQGHDCKDNKVRKGPCPLFPAQFLYGFFRRHGLVLAVADRPNYTPWGRTHRADF